MSNPVKKILSGSFDKKKALMFTVTALTTLIVWNMPADSFGIEDLTIVQQRTIAIFVMAVMLWITEAIPSWATSVTIIFVLLFCVSDSAFNFLQGSEGEAGKLLDYQGIMACFADPTIILFLGGFVLAIAATKSGLDVVMARTLIAPFGNKSDNVLLGFILITGVFSMFISNTATAAMMLTFLTPVFKTLPANGKGRIALTMAIPIGANFGGMGTPIGTPPNAFAYKTLNDIGMEIGFGQWMSVMVPLVIVMLLLSWFILKTLFPFSKKTIELEIDGDINWNWRTYVVAITFVATILLWVFGKDLFGINANTVAMLPIAVFALTGVITGDDLKDIEWEVIWMVAGGFALGLAMNGTGLAQSAVKSIPFAEWNPIVILIISGILRYGRRTCSYRWNIHYPYWHCSSSKLCHVTSYKYTAKCHSLLNGAYPTEGYGKGWFHIRFPQSCHRLRCLDSIMQGWHSVIARCCINKDNLNNQDNLYISTTR